MSNIGSVAFGLRPVKRYGDNEFRGATTPYFMNGTTNSTAAYIGTPVIRSTLSNASKIGHSGQVGGHVGSPAGAMFEAVNATLSSTNRITGPVVSVGYTVGASPASQYKYRVASTDAVIMVYDDPQGVFEILAETTMATTDIGLNGNCKTTGGSTVTGLSSTVLDATMAADATKQLLILAISKDPVRNDVTASYPVAVVKINLHTAFTDDIAGA